MQNPASMPKPTLHLICGRIAAGKSTLATTLGHRQATVMIREDDWLSGLYGEQMSSIQDYMRCTALLRSVVGPHVAALLNAGLSVVLDFQANTLEARSWMAALALTTNRSMNPGDLADEKTAPAVRLETMDNFTRSPAVDLVWLKPLDRDGHVTEGLTLAVTHRSRATASASSRAAQGGPSPVMTIRARPAPSRGPMVSARVPARAMARVALRHCLAPPPGARET
jgi:hypothetical protein